MSRIVLFCTVLFFLAPRQWNAFAQLPPGLISECDFCSCSQGISPLEMGGSALRYDLRYTELSHEYVNGTRVTNSLNSDARYLTNQLTFTYGVMPRLCALLIVPMAHKIESSVDPNSGPASVTNSGVGDISLLARYQLLADHKVGDTRIVSVTGGVKFANGNTSLHDQGQPADPDVQLGTGTTDFFAGVGYLIGFEEWSIGANLLAGFPTFGTGAVFDNMGAHHSYGKNLNYDVTARYRVYQTEVNMPASLGPTIFAAMAIRGEWRGYELVDGNRIENSGGNVSYLAPGIQVYFTPRISLDASVWVPFVHALNGDQIGETVKVLTGVQVGL